MLHSLDLDTDHFDNAHFGLGLAGANNNTLKRLFMKKAPAAASVRITSDAFIAMLGAHGGKPGGVVSVGTGSVGYSIGKDGNTWQSGGWGYPVDDKGSGAWIGAEAVSVSLKALDGRVREPVGDLEFYRNVLAQVGDTRDHILDWLQDAGPTAMATLAPNVIQAAGQGHEMAIDILARAGREIDLLAVGLDPTRHIPMAIVGGLAEPLRKYLPPALTNWIRPADADALGGAHMLARGQAPEERLQVL
jgi:glucosamine kinase